MASNVLHSYCYLIRTGIFGANNNIVASHCPLWKFDHLRGRNTVNFAVTFFVDQMFSLALSNFSQGIVLSLYIVGAVLVLYLLGAIRGLDALKVFFFALEISANCSTYERKFFQNLFFSQSRQIKKSLRANDGAPLTALGAEVSIMTDMVKV